MRTVWLRQAQEEYLRRMGPFARVDVIEVEPSPMTHTVTAEMSMKEEGARILKRLPEGWMVVALDRAGKATSSVKFASSIEEAGDGVVFVVGGAAGLDHSVLAAANRKLSLSTMTLTHEWARVLLLEQLYRGFMISSGREYHL